MAISGNALKQKKLDRLMLILVITLAASSALVIYLEYLQISRLRWAGMDNDRNAHYLLGLSLALDIRQLDLKNLLVDLEGARVWPPLHGILVAGLLLVGGLDYRLAVFPSLAGWIGTVVLGFVIARRTVPRGRNLAGWIAAIFILASPAHRVFATDVMLESLGSCLSLLVLYLYLVAVQEPSERAYKYFALALTALFFLKYNYWLLVVAGLLAAQITDQPKVVWSFVRERIVALNWRAWAAKELQHPLNWVALTSLVLMFIVILTGGWRFELWGKPISMRSHHNFLQVAYVAFFIRGILWWKKSGRAWSQALDFRLRQVLRWHLWPVALWLLLPKRLAYFLYFLSPANGANSPTSLFWGLDFYWSRLQEDYHTGTLSALVAVVLMLVAVFTVRRLKPGTSAIVLFVILAAFLTIAHPNRKSRFLHSWIPAAWILAGSGAAQILYGFTSRRRKTALAASLVGLVAVWQLQDPFAPGHSPEVGHQDLGRSTLDLADYYLPYLQQSRHVALFATVPAKHFLQWTFLERYHHRDRPEVMPNGFGPSSHENALKFQKWLQTTPSDTVVFIDIPPGSPFYFRGEDYYQQFRELLSSQSVFHPSWQKQFPECGCTVSLWQRKAVPRP
jgi:hypothetical protein